MSTALLMTKDEALARRAEIRATVDQLHLIDKEAGWDDDSPNFRGSYADEMDAVNKIAGVKDCGNCDRDYDANYPGDYCPWCVTVYNGSNWDWPRDKHPRESGVYPADIPEGQGVWSPQCPDGQGEMRCLYVEDHTGPHRFRYPSGKITEWPA